VKFRDIFHTEETDMTYEELHDSEIWFNRNEMIHRYKENKGFLLRG